MKRLKRRRVEQIGLMVLFGYLAIVVGVEIVRVVTNLPVVSWLASSPEGLGHGQWWRLFTSAFLIEGPPIPQVIITGALGALIVWFRGSWFFWAIAGAGHVLGTLLTYLGVLAAGVLGSRQLHHFLVAPDYGISLVWCAALGAVAAAAWLGPDVTWRVPYRPYLAVGSSVLVIAVALLSPGFEGIQHTVAFAVGAFLIIIFDRHGEVSRHKAVKHAI